MQLSSCSFPPEVRSGGVPRYGCGAPLLEVEATSGRQLQPSTDGRADELAVLHAARADQAVGDGLDVAAPTLEYHDLQTVVAVEVDMGTTDDGGGMLVLHSIPPVIRQSLELLRIGTILPLAAGQAEAVDLVTAPS